MRFFANARYEFLGKRRVAITVAVASLLVSIVAMIGWQLAGRSWVNYGVDFTGGTLVQIRVPTSVTASDIRGVVDPVSPSATITGFGSPGEYLIRTAEFVEEGATDLSVADQIVAAVQNAYGADQVTVVRTEAVGAKVGDDLQRRALLAILFSFAATLIYLAFRFEWRFGVAAVIATFIDTVVALGLISILRLEVSLATVAAVLTIFGYSLNDKIIVFDRVRENLKALGRRESLEAILNRSVNETLPRTVMTSVTTLLTLTALAVFGGSVIRDFALVLIAGIVIGTLSSMFIAPATLFAIQERWPKKQERKGSSSRPKQSRMRAAV